MVTKRMVSATASPSAAVAPAFRSNTLKHHSHQPMLFGYTGSIVSSRITGVITKMSSNGGANPMLQQDT